MYCFHTIIELKNGKLKHHKPGTPVQTIITFKTALNIQMQTLCCLAKIIQPAERVELNIKAKWEGML